MLSGLHNPVWTPDFNVRDPAVLKVEGGYRLYFSRFQFGEWNDRQNWTVGTTFTKDFRTFSEVVRVTPVGYASPGDPVEWHGRLVLPYQSYPARPVELCYSVVRADGALGEPIPFLQDAAKLPWNTETRVIDPTFVIRGDTLHCYFVGTSVVDGVRANLLGHATTTDPNLLEWKILSTEHPLMGASADARDGVENVAVFKDAGRWVMIYSKGLAKQRLSAATSTDLYTWTEAGEIDLPMQKWMTLKRGAPFVWREDGRWVMLLMGTNDQDRTTLGLLESTDGLRWVPLPE